MLIKVNMYKDGMRRCNDWYIKLKSIPVSLLYHDRKSNDIFLEGIIAPIDRSRSIRYVLSDTATIAIKR